jgi:hypothetical protein
MLFVDTNQEGREGRREGESDGARSRERERERETPIVVQLYSEALDDVKQKASS